MSKVFYGKSNIEVKVIADSISPKEKRLTTFELTYPRIIHAELMTHKMFSRNAMSSRAVPVKRMVEIVREQPAMPVRFGANQPGMQDKGFEHDGQVTLALGASIIKLGGRDAWIYASNLMGNFALAFDAAGYHKQVCNRLIEPFQMMKTVLTATEFNNFWWLRVDADADPTIEELAKVMQEAYEESVPELLQPGQWHTPYVEHFQEFLTEDGPGVFRGYYVEGSDGLPQMLTEEEALAISASCCGQVSYRRLDSTKEKALDVYGRLLNGRKVHASPFEHQGTPVEEYLEIENSDYITIRTINNPSDPDSWQKGISHVDRKKNFWSGNLCGFVQHRQLLENNFVSG